MAAAIEDYALIGDCETAALISCTGSVDWLCWPRFDSGACFAALLGTPDNGRWWIGARDPQARLSRAYRGDSLILETHIETSTGRARVIDFMPPRGDQSDLVRIIVGESGSVELAMELVLRFEYGLIVPWVTRRDGVLRAVAGPDLVTLRTDVPVRGERMRTVGEFTVRAGERASFVLTHSASHRPPPAPIDADAALHATEDFWRRWIGHCTYDGDWAPAVRRSIITLKALTYAPTGGIVAAPTTSLPECAGGERNWDYRFCWLRDATLTLLALMDTGFYEEATAWRDWLLRAAAGSPSQIQIMYGLAGERRLPEGTIEWLPGFGNAAPVRVGNAAHGQRQLDVFGEVMDALHQARQGVLAPDESGWALQRALLAHLGEVWREPDEGLWEVRSEPRHFTYSKVMAWVAFDRGLRSAAAFGLDGPLDRWRETRDAIHADVCEHGYDAAQGCFVQSYGSRELDASLLLLPQVGFLPASDPRIAGTVRAVEQRLMRDGLVLRYDSQTTADGLPPGEGAFLACSFWLADAWALQGRTADARALFERLLGLANDVGLLAEEYDPHARRLLGNFPQAFSHVALVSSAHNLSHPTKPADQRAG